jgi:hypothetical protein
MRADEDVLICLRGAKGQALVALEDRLLMVKAGFMAGAAFGGKVTMIPYLDVTGLQIHTHLMTAVLEVRTPSYSSAVSKSYWSQDKSEDPWKAPNCIPIGNKKAAAQWHPYLDVIRNKIAEAKRLQTQPASAPGRLEPGPEDFTQALERLDKLHRAGGLTDAEFEQAKGKLLSS